MAKKIKTPARPEQSLAAAEGVLALAALAPKPASMPKPGMAVSFTK